MLALLPCRRVFCQQSNEWEKSLWLAFQLETYGRIKGKPSDPVSDIQDFTHLVYFLLIWARNICNIFISHVLNYKILYPNIAPLTSSFSLRQAHNVQNVQASWLLDVVFAACLSLAFWQRRRWREVRHQSAFVAVRSLLSVRCLHAHREEAVWSNNRSKSKYGALRCCNTAVCRRCRDQFKIDPEKLI